MWYKVEEGKKTMTYICTYVDDFMIIGNNPKIYMERFQKEFFIRNMTGPQIIFRNPMEQNRQWETFYKYEEMH